MSFCKAILLLFFPISLLASNLHMKLLEPLLGIKYRIDGTTNIYEKYTLFENQNKIYKKAGLNCSGFVLTGAKQLLGKNIKIDSAKKDINQNSGENSSMGKDWDFGRDLILNIAKPFSHRFLNYDTIDTNSTTSDGININNTLAWSDIFKRMKKENIYLVAFSKPTEIKGYKYLYSHVGIMIKDDNNNIWLYHSTEKNGVHKIWMDFDTNMTPFKKEYPKSSSYEIRALVLELDLS